MTDPRRSLEIVWTNAELEAKIEDEGGLGEALDWGVAQVLMEDALTAEMLYQAKEAYKTFASFEYVLMNYLEANR